MADEAGTVAQNIPLWVDFARSMIPMMAKAGRGDRHLRSAVAAQREEGVGYRGRARSLRRRNCEMPAGRNRGVGLAQRADRGQGTRPTGRYRIALSDDRRRRLPAGIRRMLRPRPAHQLLHHFPVQTCESLLRKIHRSLCAGRRVITLEFVPDENRVTPPPVAEFSLIMRRRRRKATPIRSGSMSRCLRRRDFPGRNSTRYPGRSNRSWCRLCNRPSI